MAYSVKYLSEHGYVSVVLEGEVPMEEFFAVRQETAPLLTENNCKNLLVDATNTTEMLTLLEDYEFTSQHTEYFPPPIRTAVLIRQDHADHMQFVENVAQNRGVNLVVFGDKDEALEWLFDR